VAAANFEGRTVQLAGALVVFGRLAAAELTTGGGLSVDGLLTGPAGRYTVGGDLAAHAIESTGVLCRGNVHVRDALRHCRLTTTGRLEMPDGDLVGGDVAVNGGIVCRDLGAADGVPTLVECGRGRALRLLTDSIATHLKLSLQQVQAKRAGGQSMLDQAARLTAQEKERATEILFEAEELEARAAKVAALLEQRRRRTVDLADARVVVHGTLYPGVSLRLGDVRADVCAVIPGPVTLTPDLLAAVQGVRVVQGPASGPN
jgi:uncharacterized protein (DUF342 family)